MIRFTVPGRAQPGGSKRAFIRGNRAVVTDANKDVGAWKERVAIAARQAYYGAPLEGALYLEVRFEIMRPASHYTSRGALTRSARPYPSVKPDTTKLVRAVEDALTGVVWRDDAQVVFQLAGKTYGVRDEVTIIVALCGEPVDGALFPSYQKEVGLAGATSTPASP